jgi:Ankyrin repeats (3 copies)/Ankyrin repeat
MSAVDDNVVPVNGATKVKKSSSSSSSSASSSHSTKNNTSELVTSKTYENAQSCGFTFVLLPLESLQQMNRRKGRLPGLKRTKPQEDEENVYKSKIFLLAAARGDGECMRRMLNEGGDVAYQNVHGESAAFLAAGNGMGLLQTSIELGCPLDIRSRSRQTVLHQAVREGKRDLLVFLVEQGVPVDYDTWDGSTAMHIAAKFGLIDILRLLVEHGASASTTNGSGTLPLHWAIRKGEFDACQFLVEQGSPVNTRSYQFSMFGDEPLHLAARKQHKPIIKLLVENGAKFKFCTFCKKGKACERVNINWQKYVANLVAEHRKLGKRANGSSSSSSNNKKKSASSSILSLRGRKK